MWKKVELMMTSQLDFEHRTTFSMCDRELPAIRESENHNKQQHIFSPKLSRDDDRKLGFPRETI
jgi:hypothetical protein